MLHIENVTYQYQEETNSERAAGLTNLNLVVKEGEFLVVAGRSGCGKTTLSKCINGLIPHFEEGELTGSVELQGLDTRKMSLGQIGTMVGSVFQDPRSQFFTTTVLDELLFGCHNLGLSEEETRNRVEHAIQATGIEALRDRNLLTLSSGEKQKVAIAACCCMNPGILLFDEPSANLDPQSVEEFREFLIRLKNQGHTILVFEHRLYYLTDILDRMIVMEAGSITTDYSKEMLSSITRGQMQTMGLRSLQPLTYKVRNRDKCNVRNTTKPVLEMRRIAYCYHKKCRNTLENLEMTAYHSEIIALVGENGVGKTTCVKVITGLLKEQSGEIRIHGKVMKPKQRLREIYYVLQDSDYQLFTESVEKELMLGIQDTKKKREQMDEILQCFHLSKYRNQHPMALSRGQKQRLTIAAAIMSDAEILILDEPSSGLDGESMRELAGVLRRLAADGRCILLITHDAELIQECATRILRLENGKLYKMGGEKNEE